MALKGNLQDKAAASFQQALSLNPYIWEAFEGLCSLGAFHVLCLVRRFDFLQALFRTLTNYFLRDPFPPGEHCKKNTYLPRRPFLLLPARHFLPQRQLTQGIYFVHGNQIQSYKPSYFEWVRLGYLRTQCEFSACWY